MKFSERWLRHWVDPPIDTETLVSQLTTSGLEVESVEPVAPELAEVVVGAVARVEPHPGAERLSVCRVDAGRGQPLTVVCGAPNVHAGMRAPMALAGARLPGGVSVEAAVIRGVQSEGMLCSARELGLGDEAGGLLELDPDAPPGDGLEGYLGLDDVSIEVAVTPNRGDCLGVAGIAREVAVLNRAALSPPPLAPVPAALEDTFPVRLDAPEDCPIYVGRVIRGVDPGARTPSWMQERLRRSGLRSISPVVDVTNYVMLELGQPMHAFDLDTLEGGIRVRHARPGERLTLLDEQAVELAAGTLVIADERNAVAMAGVMGGLDTAVGAGSRHIFLESAFFTPKCMAGTARGYGLATDSAYRFERGVEPGLQSRAAERATALLLDIVGGEPGPLVEAVERACLPARRQVRLRASQLQRLLGLEVAADTVRDVLERLGMTVTDDGHAWEVTPPPYRFDIELEADLIEEVARVVGYERVPSERPQAPLAVRPRPEAMVPAARLRAALVERGYHEAITYSFVDPGLQAQLDPEGASLRLANPIASDMAAMRTSLWPGLLQALAYNGKRQQERVRLFESGRVYRYFEGRLAEEPVLGAVAAGPVHPEQWGVPRRAADFYDVKGDVEALLALTGEAASAFRFVPAAPPALHPGQAARIERAGREVGLVGSLHPGIARQLKLPGAVQLFELRLEQVQPARLPRFEPISRFPAVRRDIAVVVEESVPAQAVRECVGQLGVDMLKELELFDVYCGEGIDSGKKSFALGLTFQAPSRTLTDDEIDSLVATVVEALSKDLGAVLRG